MYIVEYKDQKQVVSCDECGTGQPSTCPCFLTCLAMSRLLGDGARVTRNGRTLAAATRNYGRDIIGAQKTNDTATGIVRPVRRRGSMLPGTGRRGRGRRAA